MIKCESSNPSEETITADTSPAISEYLCDMRSEKFASPLELQEHRAV